MSKSRLEKFLYALYSLDSSDLPNPLSRIEELYKCLVTGDEAPTFEPLSRVEKYLMAILGGYDVELLPNPLSRVEVLLYKLATGDDNLDDVKTFLSEHEELLAEIIRNGGVGGNIDIEYVLYTLSTEFNTLYNTAKKPVKSAILKGQTLVNISTIKDITTYNVIKGIPFKTNSSYLFIYDLEASGENVAGWTFRARHPDGTFTGFGDVSNNFENLNGEKVVKVTFSDKVINDLQVAYLSNQDGTKTLQVLNLMIIEYQEGMENWDISYFEGMKSVKMPVLTTTGKNLLTPLIYGKIVDSATGSLVISSTMGARTDYIPIDNTKNYTLSNTTLLGNSFVVYYDKDKNYISRTTGVKVDSITIRGDGEAPNPVYNIPSNTEYIIYSTINIVTTEDELKESLSQVHMYEGITKSTSYEPYKSNILTVNEPIELRGIGGGSNRVEDELNCLTGEVTQRIGEVTFDGDETKNIYKKWVFDFGDGYIGTYITLPDIKGGENSLGMICSTMSEVKRIEVNGLGKECVVKGSTYIGIILEANSHSDLLNKLSQNPITVQYLLATPTVKTVDLSVVNQDGNNTKLSTFNDITHVTLSSEGLIPVAELEVATKNEEDLEDSSVYTTHTLSEEFNTLYNTAEKPVKSAILMGHTFINIISTISSENYKYNDYNISFIDKTKRYFIKYKSTIPVNQIGFIVDNNAWNNVVSVNNLTDGYVIIKPDESKEIKNLRIRFNNADSINPSLNIVCIEYQTDMENWDIPYFEGMQSVKMPVLTITGKNLMHVNHVRFDGITANSGSHPQNLICTNIPVVEGKTYRISGVATHSTNITRPVFCRFEHSKRTWATNHQQLYREIGRDNSTYTFTVPQGIHYVSYTFGNQVYTNDGTPAWLQFDNILLEESSTTTEYEPYKSNILSTSEDVELRGIGDVQDTLDCLTGEVTERVGTGELNGTESWIWKGFNTDISFIVKMSSPIKNIKSDSKLLLDKFNYGVGSSFSTITFREMDGTIGVYLPKNTIDDWENDWEKKLPEFLSKNNINFKYELATESIKTVDLSVVDQDGNNTELKTFDDITHVTLSSEGLIPEAELEVAEKVPEVAVNMLGISSEQEVINTTINEQSENVDATMIATTEIYEELL